MIKISLLISAITFTTLTSQAFSADAPEDELAIKTPPRTPRGEQDEPRSTPVTPTREDVSRSQMVERIEATSPLGRKAAAIPPISPDRTKHAGHFSV